MMSKLYLVADQGEIGRRRPKMARGQLVEAWPDLFVRGEFWMGERSKALLDEAGPPLPAKLAVEDSAVPVYYGPRLADLESLPDAESLQTRVLSAHGIAAVWITMNQLGERTQYEPQGPADPVFYLRRPGGRAAHVWRLFQSRREAQVYMTEYFGRDPDGRQWAEHLPAANWEDMLTRYATQYD